MRCIIFGSKFGDESMCRKLFLGFSKISWNLFCSFLSIGDNSELACFVFHKSVEMPSNTESSSSLISENESELKGENASNPCNDHAKKGS